MKTQSYFKILILFLFISCYSSKEKTNLNKKTTDFIIAFGSCNKQFVENVLWKEIIKTKPDLWIWGGDNIYSDTDNMNKMKADYEQQMKQVGYKELVNSTEIMATWDDHDYGLNDGGLEFKVKNEAQQLFLDFFAIPEDSPRRTQEGIYTSKTFSTEKGSIKVIVLDTRYFRSSLQKSTEKGRRYEPKEEGTMLGERQWSWLQNELKTSEADFTILVSSIQFLSSEHGFERWYTFPNEVEKLKNLIKESSSNVFILSGDRHFSEFSEEKIEGLKYPLIDFTSSGLTHSYSNFTGEPNRYRKGNVISDLSFGILQFDFANKTVIMQMRGKNNILQQEKIQSFR